MRVGFFLFTLVMTALLVSSCSKEADYHGQPDIVIGLHSTVKVNPGSPATLRFDEVVSDSRCPANALCAWAGIAIAKFTFTNGLKEFPLMLSVMPGYPKQDTIINGYYIEFSDLKPYPGLSPTTDGKQTVQAEMKILRLQ